MNGDVLPVSLIEEGEEGLVYLVSGGKALMSRLAAMGIINGTNIKVLRNTGGQVIVLASDTRIALGRGQADKILVAKKDKNIDEAPAAGKTEKGILVALAGQPNVGKTTVF